MRWLKRIGYAVAGLVALALIAVGAIYTISEVRFRRTYTAPLEIISVRDDSASIARGAHIAQAIAGCEDCHGEGLRGAVMLDEPPLGRLVALNLTRGQGGIGEELTPTL